MAESRVVRGWYESPDGVISYSSSCTLDQSEFSRFGKATETYRFQVTILEDIGTIGWENVISLSSSCREIELTVDSVTYGVSVTVSEDYPRSAPKLQLRHFGNPAITWNPTMHLSDIRNIVSLSVQKYKVFLETVEEVDESVHVVHSTYQALPDSRSDDGLLRPCVAVRALLVDTGAAAMADTYCEVTILPDSPVQIPQVRMHGAGAAQLKAAWDRNQDKWSISRTFRQNVEYLLDAPLAARRQDLASTQLEDAEGAPDAVATCDICYALEGQGAAGSNALNTPAPSQQPSVSCKNRRCRHVYHEVCIRRWLQSASACKVSFGVLFGTCPYCAAALELPA